MRTSLWHIGECVVSTGTRIDRFWWMFFTTAVAVFINYLYVYFSNTLINIKNLKKAGIFKTKKILEICKNRRIYQATRQAGWGGWEKKSCRPWEVTGKERGRLSRGFTTTTSTTTSEIPTRAGTSAGRSSAVNSFRTLAVAVLVARHATPVRTTFTLSLLLLCYLLYYAFLF